MIQRGLVLWILSGWMALSMGCTGEASVGDDDVAGDDDATGDDDDATGDDDDATGDDDDATGDDDTSADDDDTSGDDDDTSGDDDDTAGDDDDTVGDDDVDDNTCDDGATSSSVMQFVFTDTDENPLSGATWGIYDLDAHTGMLDASPTASGVTVADGFIDATLDCANGWMLLEVAHPSYLTIHAYFQVFPVTGWVIVSMDEITAAFAIGWGISSSDEGLLALYRIGTLGNPDMQGSDSFTVDGGGNLVPAAAANDLGMWIYDGGSGLEMFGIWMVGADMPDHGAVAAMRYEDSGSGEVTLLNAPIWSYADGGANHNQTVLYVVD